MTLVVAGLFVLVGTERGPLPATMVPLPVGRRPQPAAAYGGGQRSTLVGADLHAGRRRHAIHLAGVRSALSLDLCAELAPGGDAGDQPSTRSCQRGGSFRRGCRGARLVARRSRQPRAAGLDRAPRPSFCLAAIGAMVVLIGNVIPHPREHALGATAAALFGYVVLHAGIGLLFLLSNFMRLAAGFISPRRLTDLRLTRLWLDYTAVTGAIAIGLVLALPTLVGILGMRP